VTVQYDTRALANRTIDSMKPQLISAIIDPNKLLPPTKSKELRNISRFPAKSISHAEKTVKHIIPEFLEQKG